MSLDAGDMLLCVDPTKSAGAASGRTACGNDAIAELDISLNDLSNLDS
jgi:hypothetical protein